MATTSAEAAAAPCAVKDVRASSVLDDDNSQYGPRNVIDSNTETCWNSDQGSPQWLAVRFTQPVFVTELVLMFQGGFAALEADVLTRAASSQPYSLLHSIHPQDSHAEQVFALPSTPEPVRFLRLLVRASSDLYGRIIVYSLQCRGHAAADSLAHDTASASQPA